MRRVIVANAKPNVAHEALARAEASGRRVAIVTQNVDDLHERAGSREVLHVHGTIWQLKCMNDGSVFEDRRAPLPVLPPRCPQGHIARPNIVWWDEDLEPSVVTRIENLLTEPFDVALVIGTEASFDYIRDWALRAKMRGAILVEINPRRTILTADADFQFSRKAGEVLSDVVAI